jgi:hypothetical protein
VSAEWPIWRLVCEGVATLTEIETGWGLGDVLDANEALDAFAAAHPRRR